MLGSTKPIQRMLLRLQKYDFILSYKPGKEMVIADTLSRAGCIDTNTDCMEEELSYAVHMTVALYSTPTSDVRLQEIIEATQHHAVTETNCTDRMARKKNSSTERSQRILERQGQNIQNQWFNHEMGTVGNTYWLKDRNAETNTHGPHGDSKMFPACQGTDVLARHVQSHRKYGEPM